MVIFYYYLLDFEQDVLQIWLKNIFKMPKVLLISIRSLMKGSVDYRKPCSMYPSRIQNNKVNIFYTKKVCSLTRIF